MSDNIKLPVLEIPVGRLRGTIHKLHQSFDEIDEILQHISEQDQLLRTVSRRDSLRVKRLQDIINLAEMFFNVDNEMDIYNAAVNILREIISPNAAIRLLCSSSDRLKLQLVLERGTIKITGENGCPAQGVCMVMKQVKPLVSPSRNKGLFCRHLDPCREVQGHICSPLIGKGDFIGCISLLTQQDDPFPDQDDIEVIRLISDVTSLAITNVRTINTITRNSLTDSLTGLPNRRYALAALQSEVERTNRYGGVFTIAMVDIDRFKEVNDTYGHNEGDRVLTTLAHTASRYCRTTDIATRFGGEEFLFILPQTDIPAALNVIERFRAAFNEASHFGMLKASNITLSAGMAQYPADGQDSPPLLKTADRRLYQAKEAGRNQVVSSD